MNESILFVDDEIQILNALNRTFYRSKYRLFYASSGAEALKIMQNEKIDLLISDIRMPIMNGYELLLQVKAKYPSIIRMVLSGYADDKLVVDIQKENLAKLYLLKPWKNQELLQIVGQTFRVEKILKDKNLLEFINKIEYLPSPGNTYYRFNMLVEHDADINKIAQVIESDQSITAKILQVANSAMYGLNTGSVRKAITYLGLNNVKYIILSTRTFIEIKGKKSEQLNNDVNFLWKHALTTNYIFTFLYNHFIGQRIPDMYSLVGLLHDIGKVILIHNFTDQYLKAATSIKNKEDLYYYYERMEFTHISHEELGAYLLNWWELPQSIVEAVLNHHNPLNENVIDKKLLCLLYVSDIYSLNYLCGSESKSIDPEVLKQLSISKEEFNQLISQIDLNKIIN